MTYQVAFSNGLNTLFYVWMYSDFLFIFLVLLTLEAQSPMSGSIIAFLKLKLIGFRELIFFFFFWVGGVGKVGVL